jgi:K+/H+ antiporter YhaU regulatory subunit KhtT
MPVASHRVDGSHWAKGRSMGDLGVRAKTNASIIAIQRGEVYITSPSADEELKEGDVLYLVGDESDVMLARNLLSTGR